MKAVKIIIILFVFSSPLFSMELTQTLKGVVKDNATQIPLPGANVIIKDTNPLLGTTTDADGRFRINNVPIGRYHIIVSYTGYKSVTLPGILLSTGKETVLSIELEEDINKMEAVVVTSKIKKQEALNSMATLSARTFSVEETRRYAGGMDDPARMASSFAGVTTGNIQDNAIVIRGNSPKGVQWRLEGVEIPNPNHFAGGNVAGGGFVTVFSSQMLTNSDFFTGAFPAEYGNALAGVFDMKLRTGNIDKNEYTFQLGTMGADISAEGPFKKGSNASFLFNYRYSTMKVIAPIIDTEQVPEWQDLSFKLNFPTKKAGVFSLWMIGAIDRITEPVEKDSTKWETSWERRSLNWNIGMAAMGLNHRFILGSSSYINTSLTGSYFNNVAKFKWVDDNLTPQDNQKFTSNENSIILSTYINKKFSARHVNRTGFVAKRMNYSLDLKEAPDDIPPLKTLAKEEGNANLVQFYSQSKYKFSDKFHMNAGIHSMYFSVNKKISVEPRIGFTYKYNSSNSFSIAYGLHSQVEPLKVYLTDIADKDGNITNPNRELGFTKSHHFVFGYDRMLGENLRLKVEPYFQYLYNAPVQQDSTYSILNFKQDWAFNRELHNSGKGYNVGIDITFERFLKNNFYYLVTGSVFDSKYRDDLGKWRDTRYNRNFSVNLLVGKEFIFGREDNKIFGINGRFTMYGGERRHPVDIEKTMAKRSAEFDENRAFETQDPSSYILNISLTYRVNRKRYSSVWALQVLNVLGSKITSDPEYNYKTNSIEDPSIAVVVPSISYKIMF